MQQVFGLLPRLLEYLFLLRFHARHSFVIIGDTRFQFFLFLANRLSFFLPIPLVAGYVLELTVVIDMLLAYQVCRISDDWFAQSCLSGYFDGKRTAGLSYGQLEERSHRTSVVEHRSVDHSFGLFSKVLEVGVMGCDDAEHMPFHQFTQDSLGYRAAYERFGTCAHLIDEDKRVVICVTQESTHVAQV